jgi:hypothetical protein
MRFIGWRRRRPWPCGATVIVVAVAVAAAAALCALASSISNDTASIDIPQDSFGALAATISTERNDENRPSGPRSLDLCVKACLCRFPTAGAAKSINNRIDVEQDCFSNSTFIETILCSAKCQGRFLANASALDNATSETPRPSSSTSRHSASLHNNQQPNERTMTFRQLSQLYGCDDDATFQHGIADEGAANAQRRPIHNASTWYYLRGVYNAVIRRSLCKDENDPARWNGDHTTDAPHCYVNGVDTGPIEWRLPDTPVDGSGFFVPVAVQYSPGKGRGVFATEPIRKGQSVWVSWYEGWMLSGLLYRQLLDALPTNALKCDLMAFTYFTATGGGSSASVGDDVALYYEGEGEGDEGYEDAADGDAEVDEGEVDEEEGDGEGEEEEYDADTSLADVSASGFHSSEVPARYGDEEEDSSNSSVPSKVTERGRQGGAIDGEAQISTGMDDSDERKTRNPVTAASDSETRTRMIIIALDEAAVMNADWDSADGGRSNVNVGPSEECCDDDADDADADVLEGIGGLAHYAAFRDIQAGEEIICDYHNFALDDEGWSRFGL